MLFFSKLLGDSRSFAVSYEFQNQFVSFYQNVYWDFDWDCIASVSHFRESSFLTILNHLVHEQDISFHYFNLFNFSQ